MPAVRPVGSAPVVVNTTGASALRPCDVHVTTPGVAQFLTKEDVQYDVSKGWTGYPEFAEMFAELWGVKG